MSDLQKEAATCAGMASTYRKIQAVFDDLPARFRMKDVMDLAGVKPGYTSQRLVKAILDRDFRCVEVGYSRVMWKKPAPIESSVGQ